MRLHKPMLDALDRYIAEQPDDPSRPEAARRIIGERLGVKPDHREPD